MAHCEEWIVDCADKMLVFVDIEKVLFFIQNIKFYLAKKLVAM